MDAGPSAETVAPALRAAVLRLARRLRVERDRSALSNNKVAILSHLAREGESTPSRIAAEERQQLQSLSRPLAELEDARLIERTTDRRDARRSVLRLTAEGRAAFDADMALRDQWLTGALDDLDPDKLRLLAAAAGMLERLGGSRD
jgi:DNA-binding MarR family transcriptional regulator